MTAIAAKYGEQRAAEAEVEDFRHDLGPFVVTAETTRMPMVFTDALVDGNPIIFANDSVLRLTGYKRDELLAQRFDFLLAADAADDDRAAIEAAFAGGLDDAPEVCAKRKDGSPFWTSLFISPVKDEAGNIVQHFISLIDQSHRHAARMHAAMLIEELNHRVKNTLATVQSIVAQAVRHQTDPAVIRVSIESRIDALSRSHDLLSQEKWAGAGLYDVVNNALAPFGAMVGRPERFTIDGENIHLSPRAALALGIALHELATNAVKYGAFSNEAGSIAVSWSMEHRTDVRWLCLHWRERGGPPVSAPTRRGFGSRVLERGLPHELGGRVTLDYPLDGFVCMIDIPAPHIVND